jgi:uncharacterized protein (UPF0332 family)
MQENTISLWVIVCSYYAMYYIANAVLLEKGYTNTGKLTHKVTADALIALIRNDLAQELLQEYQEVQEEALQIAQTTSDQLIQDYEYERRKRNRIQYETTQEIKEAKATTSLNRAKRFVFELEQLL